MNRTEPAKCLRMTQPAVGYAVDRGEKIAPAMKYKMTYMLKNKKAEKSTSDIKIPNPMAMGVIRISMMGLRMVAIKVRVIFMNCWSRSVPKVRSGPLQNCRKSFPGILTSQSVSRV